MPYYRPKDQKLMGRFYEVLALLNALGSVQGDRIKGDQLDLISPSAFDDVTLRRKALESLCVACDFKKGGDTVTAIALGKTPAGPTYWLASNSMWNRIEEFLRDVLTMLEAAASDTTTDEKELQEKLFELFTDFGTHSLKEIWSLLQDYIQKDLHFIESLNTDDKDVEAYRSWLHRFNYPYDGKETFIRACKAAYTQRTSRFMEPSFRQQMFSRIKHDIPPSFVRHYLGRMGSRMRAAKILARAASQQPEMFNGFEIKLCPPTTPSAPPEIDPLLELDGIANRMVKTDPSGFTVAIQETLALLDHQIGLNEKIKEQYRDPTFKPRVHAELNVLENVFVNGVKFYDNDKFIACSKPACFNCYHYICNHPGGYVRPPCHNKLWMNWRPPGSTNGRDSDSKRRRDAMNETIKAVRKVAIERIDSCSGGRLESQGFRPDSTTWVSLSIAEGSQYSSTNQPSVSRWTESDDELVREFKAMELVGAQIKNHEIPVLPEPPEGLKFEQVTSEDRSRAKTIGAYSDSSPSEDSASLTDDGFSDVESVHGGVQI